MSTTLGPLVRLEGISIQQLPSGGKGAVTGSTAAAEASSNSGSGALDIHTFITNVITEAVPFIDGVAPKSGNEPTWKKKGTGKQYSSSDALVHSYERTVSGRELDKITGMSQFSADRKDETWFCRRSCHRNAAENGTASWQEFVRSFKEHHHESEDAFTPAVVGAREAITWDTEGMEVDVEGERWVDISLKMVEMKHKIDPKPLKNRTFPVLQLAASLAGTQEFIVVSIPITDFDKSPNAEYAKDKSLVVASYASIERIRILPKSGEVEWIMATASDAGGVLPQWLQNLAVPGKIAHDVDMFLAWIPSQRKLKPEKVDKVEQTPVKRAATFDKSLPAAPAQSETASMVTAPPPPISKEPDPEARLPMTREESTNKVLPAAPVQ
jgi:hypothetical protein